MTVSEVKNQILKILIIFGKIVQQLLKKVRTSLKIGETGIRFEDGNEISIR